MAAGLSTVTALINGITKSVVVGQDGAGNIAPGHALIDANGVAFGVPTNEISTRKGQANTVVTTLVNVGTSSVPAAAAGTMTKGWMAQNTTASGTGYIDLCWGATAVLGSGFIRMFPGSSRSDADCGRSLPPPGTPMSAIASIPGQTMTMTVYN
jgi:hypothetical protein